MVGGDSGVTMEERWWEVTIWTLLFDVAGLSNSNRFSVIVRWAWVLLVVT